MMPTRRALLASLLAPGEKLVPVRAITRGPKFHWFGYYDKLQFDPTSRYVLGMEVDFEHRSPRPDDEIRLGVIDLQDGDRWREIARAKAWCWQQGCMLQWLPGSSGEVIYNDREGDHYISRILNVRTGKSRTLPGPVYALSPDAKWAVATDFSRLADTRPGYGYVGVPDRYKNTLAPEQTGIWWMDLETGRRKLILSYAQVAKVPYKIGDWTGYKHRFNHLLASPDGSRFIFLHRRTVDSHPEYGNTRMFTAKPDGTDLYVVDPYGYTSHFIWRDPKHIMAWARHPSHGDKFYLYEDKTERVDVMGPEVMTENGHNTYLPGKRWVLNDTYPDRNRLQHPYLFDTTTGRKAPLGHFLSPKEYAGEWRCDNHPRFSPNGRLVTIDSPHHGGRQIYLIDISGIAG
ncbi:MAG: hypothetical protein IT167_30245 [Bryobacterales bacterium]|nr:hypothetical protein [Bryobacterales bacterium]